MKSTRIVFVDVSDLTVGIVCLNTWSMFEFTGKYLWMTKKHIDWKEMFAVVLLLQ